MNRFNRLIHSNLYLGGGRLWKAIIYRLVSFYYHCDIPCKREIIDGVYFNHRGFGIVINPNARKVRMCDASALERLKWTEKHPGKSIKETEAVRVEKAERKADPRG